MIESSGRKSLRANGTVLDLLPVGQVIAVTGCLLVALFTVVKPEASSGLGLLARAVFWSLHVGLGLGALWIAGRWLASGKRLPGGRLASILITGFAAVMLAAPGYLALDSVYAPYILDADPDEPVSSLFVKVVIEIAELAPWFLVSWLLINLPVLMPSPQPVVLRDDSVATLTENLSKHKSDNSTDSAEVTDLSDKPATSQFLISLPGVVGTDVVTVASDLHYLNVWTSAGRTTVLGNLRDVALELDDRGMLVHRSHWVAHSHVRRIVGTGSNAACILSNELRVPISRRRWKAVREQYGRGVVNVSNPSE